MFDLIFYKDKNGVSDIVNMLDQLKIEALTSKTARINRQKTLAYMKALSEHGTMLGKPFVKHIESDIWELRPLRNRIFFFYWKDDKYVLLHHFIKKTQKTPRREIDTAISKMNDYLEREEKP